jgi:hypothetical protein
LSCSILIRLLVAHFLFLIGIAALLADTVQFWNAKTGIAPVAVVAVQEDDEKHPAVPGRMVGSSARAASSSLASLYVSHHWKIVAGEAAAKEEDGAGGWQIMQGGTSSSPRQTPQPSCAVQSLLAVYRLRTDQSAYEWKLSPG